MAKSMEQAYQEELSKTPKYSKCKECQFLRIVDKDTLRCSYEFEQISDCNLAVEALNFTP